MTDRAALPVGWPLGTDVGAGTIAVHDPYLGHHVADVHAASADDVDAAFREARHHLPPPPPVERAEVLERAATLVRERAADFARVIALEAGKPITQAAGEVARAVDTLTFSAVEARRLAGESVAMEGSRAGVGKVGFIVREPVGVVGAISPFNFPLNLVAHKLGPAIAAGCPVVLKPASATPLSALGLAAVLQEAGLPEGALHVLPGSSGEVGDAIVHHPDVALISFTGSQSVGRGIQSAVPGLPVLLELGNATPVIIAADADLEDAATRIARSGYTHAGQSCVSVQRVYVHADVHDAFVDLLAPKVEALRFGDPLDPDVDVGPLISESAADDVMRVISDAEGAGGTVRVGGSRVDGHVQPTLVTDLSPECSLSRDEVFGPVIGVAAVDSVEEGCERANAAPFGLQAGVFTARVDHAVRLARRLDFGGVLINETPTFRTDQMPYGGVKESGNTREGPAYAIREMTTEKLIVIRIPDDD